MAPFKLHSFSFQFCNALGCSSVTVWFVQGLIVKILFIDRFLLISNSLAQDFPTSAIICKRKKTNMLIYNMQINR